MEKFDKEQAIADIAKNLGISEKYVKFNEDEQVYIICDKKDNQSSIIFFEKNIDFNQLQKYPLKFFNCCFNI
ncbi:hypothetical protein IY889_07565, partial [Campylobacter volucris]|nr:hypothetical protein [Campylobacter volucris]